MRQLWCGVVVLATVLGLRSSAEATCVAPYGASPSSAAAPTRGVAFTYYGYYTDTWAAPPIHWVTGAGSVVTTAVSPNITRIDYAGTPGAILQIGKPDGFGPDATLTLTETPSRFVVPRVLSLSLRRGHAGCAGWDNLTIEVDQAPSALHARWTRDGKTSDVWLVNSTAGFELGQATCGAPNLDPAELRAGGQLVLFAVAPDGSEHLILDRHVSPDNTSLVEEYVDSDGTRRFTAEDWRVVGQFFAFLVFAVFLALFLGIEPAVALHGVTSQRAQVRGRFASPLPRARVLDRP